MTSFFDFLFQVSIYECHLHHLASPQFKTLCLDKESSLQKASHQKARSRFTFSWNWCYVTIIFKCCRGLLQQAMNDSTGCIDYREGPNHFRINFATAILQYLLLGHDSMINAADVLLAATCSISTIIIDGVQYVMIAHFDALMQWLGFNAMIGSISRSAIVLRY